MGKKKRAYQNKVVVREHDMFCIAPCVPPLAQSTLSPMGLLSSYMSWGHACSSLAKARLNKKIKLLLYKSAFLRDFPSALGIRHSFFSLHLCQFFSREVCCPGHRQNESYSCTAWEQRCFCHHGAARRNLAKPNTRRHSYSNYTCLSLSKL